ncbi:RNA polymerase sigma-70 factor, ECF subfamily [Lentzea fradiae]|uniref:RNA polymerase sigma-70 factor, ECF subfamily n=1 Tax=Lentzea fradiae TaxID=200378 RepID=A0A1G7SB19_9PSEU|nr:sigma-70 family RNA polymerase sigma factor [Lentzea fradiae]SDG20183.1 RNA polymerase sigma-70 factor, ECF subfamily [Lentzea fradiae]
MTDEELWGEVRAGGDEAFGLLFERHAQAVFAYCLRRTGTWAVAEDMVSVVFMETWRKRTSVRVEGSLLPWLYTVALGATRNHQRARKRYRAALGRVPAQHADDDHADDVARRVDAETRTRAVIAELEKLPAGDREVLEMSAWSDLTQPQIAEVLGIPVGTVKSRLARAQRTVRGALVEEVL